MGDIALSARRLVVTGPVALADARFAASLADGRLVVRQLTGTGREGEWSLAFALSRVAPAPVFVPMTPSDVRLLGPDPARRCRWREPAISCPPSSDQIC